MIRTILLLLMLKVGLLNAQTFTKVTDFPSTGRQGLCSFSIGAYGYVGLGLAVNDDYRKDLYRYDPTANTWLQMADFPGTARTNAVSFSMGNYGYYGLGSGAGNAIFSDFWRYDPATNSWSAIAAFPEARFSAVAFVIGTKAYVGTGQVSASVFSNTFYSYDAATNAWTAEGAAIFEGRRGATAFEAFGKGYVVGGQYLNDQAYYVHEFDPATSIWTKKWTDSWMLGFSYGSSYVFDGKAYINLGNRITRYNPQTNFPTDLGNLTMFSQFSLWYSMSLVINGKAYMGMGYRPGIDTYFTDIFVSDAVSDTEQPTKPQNETTKLIACESNQVWCIQNTNEQNTKTSIRVFDMQGRICQQLSNVNNGDRINLSTLPTGIYMAEIIESGSKIVQKLYVGE
jgi:N-acetylneuraminic acid mutarotase